MQNSCPILAPTTFYFQPVSTNSCSSSNYNNDKKFRSRNSTSIELGGKSCAIPRSFPKRKKIPSDRIYLQTQLCSSRPSWTAHLQKKKRIASNRTRLMGEKEFSSEPLPSRNRCTRGCARLRRHFRHRAITSLTF